MKNTKTNLKFNKEQWNIWLDEHPPEQWQQLWLHLKLPPKNIKWDDFFDCFEIVFQRMMDLPNRENHQESISSFWKPASFKFPSIRNQTMSAFAWSTLPNDAQLSRVYGWFKYLELCPPILADIFENLLRLGNNHFQNTKLINDSLNAMKGKDPEGFLYYRDTEFWKACAYLANGDTSHLKSDILQHEKLLAQLHNLKFFSEHNNIDISSFYNQLYHDLIFQKIPNKIDYLYLLQLTINNELKLNIQNADFILEKCANKITTHFLANREIDYYHIIKHTSEPVKSVSELIEEYILKINYLTDKQRDNLKKGLISSCRDFTQEEIYTVFLNTLRNLNIRIDSLRAEIIIDMLSNLCKQFSMWSSLQHKPDRGGIIQYLDSASTLKQVDAISIEFEI